MSELKYLTLSQFNKVVSTTGSLDVALRIVSYTSVLTCMGLSKIGKGERKTVQVLTDVVSRISDARYINRIFGLPAMLEWFFSLKDAKTEEQKLQRKMAFCMVLYYPLEHIWWLTTVKGEPVSKAIGTQASLWSLRAWLLYVIFDMVKTKLAINQLQQDLKKPELTQWDKRTKQREIELLYHWVGSMICDFILAAQFSVVNGPFSPIVVRLAGLFGALFNMKLRLTRAAIAGMPAKQA